MKKTAIFLFLLLGISACGVGNNIERIEVSGDVVKHKESLASFKKIIVAGPIDVILEQNGHSDITIETYESMMERFHADIADGVLYLFVQDSLAKSTIKVDDKPYDKFQNALVSGSQIRWPKGKKVLNVRISFKQIESLSIIGESEVSCPGSWESQTLDIEVAGAMHLNAPEIHVKTLDVEIAGAANLELGGLAEDFKVECAGAGTIKAYDFIADHTSLDIAGVCTAQVYARNSLNVNVAGLGNIRYKGNPPEINIEKAGMGKIRQAEDEKTTL